MTGILLTGAAGLIGGEVAARLAERGHPIHALLHREPDIRANAGTLVAVPEIYRGDIAKPGFGLDEATLTKLRQSCDLLIHCAATTRFDLAEQDYRAVNIEGTRHAIELARRCGMGLLHVSTGYVCGLRSGIVTETDPLPEGDFANGYEASKAAAERLVRKSGIPHAIARPSIVVGDSRTGSVRRFDSIYQLFRQISEGRVRHIPASVSATLDLVPVDHVAAGIVAVAEAGNRASGAYHLVSGQPLPVEALARVIGSYPQFFAPDLILPEDFDVTALGPGERRLYRRAVELYASYFQRTPRFDDSRFKMLAGIGCPSGGEQLLHRLIDGAIAAGFLRGKECGLSARRDSDDGAAVGRRAPRARRP